MTQSRQREEGTFEMHFNINWSLGHKQRDDPPGEGEKWCLFSSSLHLPTAPNSSLSQRILCIFQPHQAELGPPEKCREARAGPDQIWSY